MEEQPLTMTVHIRIIALEKELESVKKQLSTYVSLRENELQIRVISTTVDRVEKELVNLSNKCIMLEIEEQKREAAIQRNQSNLQIKILWGAISTILGFIISVLVGYVIHFFH